jgi:hypothetical protein
MIKVDIQSFPPPQANTYATYKFEHTDQTVINTLLTKLILEKRFMKLSFVGLRKI